MRLSEIAKMAKGQLLGADVTIEHIVTDTRKMKKGAIFIALKGERFDGHTFLAQAAQEGAIAAVVAKDKGKIAQGLPLSLVVVEDPTLALAKWAQQWRARFDIPVTGITGSCGKTTVKSMLGHIALAQGEGLVTHGNLNNHIGVPLTLLQLNTSHRFAIIEMGANAPGDIHFLTQMARPNIAMINNIAPAHLQGFKSIEGVAQAKGEIFQRLTNNDTAILNRDDAYYDYFRKQLTCQVISFGCHPQADVRALDIEEKATTVQFNLRYRDHTCLVNLKRPGRHNVLNALGASACAFAQNMSGASIQLGLNSFRGVDGRLVTHQLSSGARLIDDSYNANPFSVHAAVNVLSLQSGQKILVLGDMTELGPQTERFHKEVGKKAVEGGITQLFSCGQMSQLAAQAFGKGAQHFKSKWELVEGLKEILSENVTILVKGSRASKMEEVVHALTLEKR